MERREVCKKDFITEENAVCRLEYSLLIQSVEKGRVYGVSIRKTDGTGFTEEDRIEGLSENREEAEQFLYRLAEGMALPVELVYLCDDFVSEKESETKGAMQEVS